MHASIVLLTWSDNQQRGKRLQLSVAHNAIKPPLNTVVFHAIRMVVVCGIAATNSAFL